jgi:hypothetical protein
MLERKGEMRRWVRVLALTLGRLEMEVMEGLGLL